MAAAVAGAVAGVGAGAGAGAVAIGRTVTLVQLDDGMVDLSRGRGVGGAVWCGKSFTNVGTILLKRFDNAYVVRLMNQERLVSTGLVVSG